MTSPEKRHLFHISTKKNACAARFCAVPAGSRKRLTSYVSELRLGAGRSWPVAQRRIYSTYSSCLLKQQNILIPKDVILTHENRECQCGLCGRVQLPWHTSFTPRGDSRHDTSRPTKLLTCRWPTKLLTSKLHHALRID